MVCNACLVYILCIFYMFCMAHNITSRVTPISKVKKIIIILNLNHSIPDQIKKVIIVVVYCILMSKFSLQLLYIRKNIPSENKK